MFGAHCERPAIESAQCVVAGVTIDLCDTRRAPIVSWMDSASPPHVFVTRNQPAGSPDRCIGRSCTPISVRPGRIFAIVSRSRLGIFGVNYVQPPSSAWIKAWRLNRSWRALDFLDKYAALGAQFGADMLPDVDLSDVPERNSRIWIARCAKALRKRLRTP